MTLKSRAKPILEGAADALGAVHFVRRGNRRRPRILMYHRFRGSEAEIHSRLRSQCEHLRRHYHSVSLTELAKATREGYALPDNSLAITVDDGYRDFAVAFPVFQSFGLKVTLYVVSGFAEGRLWLWPDQLLYLLENSPRREVTIRLGGNEATSYSLADGPARLAVFSLLCERLICTPDEGRREALQRLQEALELAIPKQAPERFAALSWAELRDLVARGLDVGAHTETHPILSRIESDEGLRQEIAGSKTSIEAELGTTVNHFCYPNGKFPDVNAQCKVEAERAGFLTAVMAEPGFANPEAGLFQMRRLGVEPEYPSSYFERFIAGYRL
jgi:peptidoglycan/xylan/chitin deacetylase (PgdA/CDA1 family)